MAQKGIYEQFVRSLAWRSKKRFCEDERIAVALSCGPESSALAALAKQWSGDVGLTKAPLGLIVDHQVEESSSEETSILASNAEHIGLNSQILKIEWKGKLPPRNKIMLEARKKRYDLLGRACAENNVHLLLTAHHANDQIETFLSRFIHASGLDGLSGISELNNCLLRTYGVTICRPFLKICRNELKTFCQEQNLPFVEEPRGQNPSLERHIIRRLLQNQTSKAIIHPKGLDSYGPRPTSIAKDVHLLQELSAKASSNLQYQADLLLQSSVLQISPMIKNEMDGKMRVLESKASSLVQYATSSAYVPRRGKINWPSKLASISKSLHSVAHVIFAVESFQHDKESKFVSIAAISRILHAVSRTEFPPRTTDCSRLVEKIKDGKLKGGFTGGACIIQPILRSKGRYALVIPQSLQHECSIQISNVTAMCRASRLSSNQSHAHALYEEYNPSLEAVGGQ